MRMVGIKGHNDRSHRASVILSAAKDLAGTKRPFHSAEILQSLSLHQDDRASICHPPSSILVSLIKPRHHNSPPRPPAPPRGAAPTCAATRTTRTPPLARSK